MAKHLPVGGSTATRTLKCPAWLERAKRMPAQPSNRYAIEGNLLHDALEDFFFHGTPFVDQIGVLTVEGLTLAEEHLPMLEACRAQAETILDRYDVDEFTCEPFVQLQTDYIGGSIDLLGVSRDRKTVVVLDYKTGRNAVKCEGNDQLMFYATCAAKDSATRDMFAEAETIVMVIVQPVVWAEPQVWQQPVSATGGFETHLSGALASTRAAPGAHCRYCPAAPVCPERKQQARAAKVLDRKTSAEVAEALELAEDITVWAKEVKDQAHALATQGASLPGYKLARGRAKRRYTPEAEEGLIAELGESAYSRKLIPITEAEKRLGAGVLEDRGWAEKPEGSLALVPESDPREAEHTAPDKNLKNFVDRLSDKV